MQLVNCLLLVSPIAQLVGSKRKPVSRSFRELNSERKCVEVAYFLFSDELQA